MHKGPPGKGKRKIPIKTALTRLYYEFYRRFARELTSPASLFKLTLLIHSNTGIERQ